MKISFFENSLGFYSDMREGGRKAPAIRYVLDRSEKPVFKYCEYEVKPTGREVASKIRGVSKIIFVTITNREEAEAPFLAQRAKEEAEAQKQKEFEEKKKEYVKHIREEIIPHYNKIPSIIQGFYPIRDPAEFASSIQHAWHPETVARELNALELWKVKFEKIQSQREMWPAIIEWIERRNASVKEAKAVLGEQYDKLLSLRLEAESKLHSLPRAAVVEFGGKRVKLLDDKDGKYQHEVTAYGQYTHYVGESDDGYRPGGSYTRTGQHMVFRLIEDEELLSLARATFAENGVFHLQIKQYREEEKVLLDQLSIARKKAIAESVEYAGDGFKEAAIAYNKYNL